MNPFFTFIHSWLLGGLTYPALTFVITAAMKSTAIVLLTWCVTAFLGRKPALMRLWLWRACSVALLSVLLWALAPRFVDSWRMNVHVYPTPMILQAVAQAQALDLLAKETPRAQPTAEAAAPLIAYTTAARPEVPLATMRVPWMERIEQIVFHAWWSVALLLLAWRAFRAVCGHFWLRRHTAGVLRNTGHRLVCGLVSPVVTGWRNACIWLPEAAAEWPDAKLRAVCLHEMAHHSRHDGAWQWLGWLTASVWWWNPLAWLALRQLTSEAELSADESALSQHIAATDYAQVLVEIATGSDLGTPAAGVAMLGHSGIQNRVKALLNGAGQHGVFGRKAKLALIVTAMAAVMAAGVEVRHVMQAEKPSEPLTVAEKDLVERSLAVLEPQIEKLQRVHVRLTETWTAEGKETVRSPQPSVIEAWVDESARQSRAEYRPRVTQWTSGAAPWYIKDETEATDGLRGWNYEGRESNEVRFSKEPQDAFFSLWEARPRARELREALKQMLASGCKQFGLTKHVIREESDRVVIERHWPGGGQMEHWEMDLKQRGLALFRQHFPKRPEPFSVEWSVQGWAALDDGTPYPMLMVWKYNSSDGPGTYTRQITALQTISSIRSELLTTPPPNTTAFVASDGKAAHGEALELKFVHVKREKPVPDVEVHYEINDGKRQKVVSSHEGVLSIALPKEEVKSLRLWGLKAGYVMQLVQWRRYGDPLKLPETYEVKLYPQGKPIGGIVVNENDEPVEGVEVMVLHRGGAMSWDVFTDVHDTGRRTKTDARGHWQLTGYEEDLMGAHIFVEHPDHKRVAMDYRSATGQSYAAMRDGTSKVVLKDDELIEMRGLVSDETGKPVAGCGVTIGPDRWGRFDEPNSKTDAQGRYRVRLQKSPTDLMTFEAAGFQPQMHTVTAATGKTGTLDIRLVQSRPLRLKLVDESGAPLPGARLCANRWQQKRTLWFEAVTDAKGHCEWNGAPTDEVQWDIVGHENVLRDVRTTASDDVQTIVFRPAIRFAGTVLDAGTGQHIKSFRVTRGDTRSSPNIYWENESRRSFEDGTFTYEVWWMRFDHKVRIEAEGYEAFETALFTPKQQEENVVIKLVPKK